MQIYSVVAVAVDYITVDGNILSAIDYDVDDDVDDYDEISNSEIKPKW